MIVTEADRDKLYDSLKHIIGEREAETFMNMMPNTDWNELATKSFVHAEIAGLESRLLRTGATWLIASQAGVIAAVAAITAFLS